MDYVVNSLIEFSGSQDEELRDIAGLGSSEYLVRGCGQIFTSRISIALKTITSELPQDGNLGAKACAKLVPKLLYQLQTVREDLAYFPHSLRYDIKPSTPPETLLETLSTISILNTRFSIHLSTLGFQVHPVKVMTPLLEHPRPAVRKRTIVTLGEYSLSGHSPSSCLTHFQHNFSQAPLSQLQ